MIVMKFGGTSVKDAAAIRRLVDIVRPAAPDVAVVVSALAGVTDRLLSLADASRDADARAVAAGLGDLRARHHDVARESTRDRFRAETVFAIDRDIDELERVLTALMTLGEVPPRWRDAIAAAGEMLASRIVAAALSSSGISAGWVDARRVIVTNDEHTAAAPDVLATNAALTQAFGPLIESGTVPVLGGFVGASHTGVTTTLGRGGSDFTGAIVGAALDVTEIQIWTDVNGMLTADPRLVSRPRPVARLSFEEAAELAYFGAKVLHPATIQPAVAKGIPVRILNSHEPSAPGTLISSRNAAAGRSGPVTAIASKVGVTAIDITSTRMLAAHGFLRRLFEVFERHRTSVDVVTTSEVSVSVTVDDRRRLDAIVSDLSAFSDVSVSGNLAIVSAVGDGLQVSPDVAARILRVLDDVPLRMVSQAASRRNVTIVIQAADLSRALARLHDHFFADMAAPAGERTA